MGGVYRIQTFFGFLYFFYIYKAPNSHVDINENAQTLKWYRREDSNPGSLDCESVILYNP